MSSLLAVEGIKWILWDPLGEGLLEAIASLSMDLQWAVSFSNVAADPVIVMSYYKCYELGVFLVNHQNGVVWNTLVYVINNKASINCEAI